jgi:hypothetical protein
MEVYMMNTMKSSKGDLAKAAKMDRLNEVLVSAEGTDKKVKVTWREGGSVQEITGKVTKRKFDTVNNDSRDVWGCVEICRDETKQIDFYDIEEVILLS